MNHAAASLDDGSLPVSRALVATIVAAGMVGRMRVLWRAATRPLPGSPHHDDYANVIAAQVIHADLHLPDLKRGPLTRRADV